MHQGKIRAYLVRLCKNYDLADDIAQETFLTAFRKLQSYKGEGNFSGWLFRIAHNCFLQHIRRTKRRTEITEQFGTEQELQTTQYDSLSTGQMDLEQALRQLNSDETSTITLCHSYGFSHQEVADILDMPLGSVIADRGFSERAEQRIAKSTNARRNIFLITGFCWPALVVICASPQTIYADFSTLVLSLEFGSIYSYALSEFQSLSALQLPYPTIAAALLSLASVASMAVRA